MRRVLLATTLATTVAATVAPPPSVAQQVVAPPHRTPRSTVWAIAGAVLGGVAGIIISRSAQSGVRGGCLGIQCAIIGTTAAGTLFGYLLGREDDRIYASRFRGVAQLHVSSSTTDVAGVPVALAAEDSTVAVAGSEGVQLFHTGAELMEQALRAGGLRGISTVAIAPRTGWLVAGSPSGLYLFPPGHGPGSLVRDGDVGAATAAPDRVYFGVGRRVEVAPFATDTTRSWPGVAVDAVPRGLMLDSARSLLWVVTDKELASYRAAGDSLERVGGVALEGAGRRLALTHDTIAVALGEHGVRLFDISNPASPRPLVSWRIAHFAYDVSIDQGRLFVAAGPEGVYVLDFKGGVLRTLGLARSLGFASALASRGGYTYILDRRANAVRRILSDF